MHTHASANKKQTKNRRVFVVIYQIPSLLSSAERPSTPLLLLSVALTIDDGQTRTGRRTHTFLLPSPSNGRSPQVAVATVSPTMFQQNNARGAGGATRRKFGTSIDVNSARNNDAAGKAGKGGVPVEKRTTRSMAAGGGAGGGAFGPTTSRSNQTRDDVDASSRPSQGGLSRISSSTSRSSSFTVSNASSYQHTGQVDNIDERDREDPLCATDYVQEMVSTFAFKYFAPLLRTTTNSIKLLLFSR